MDFHLNAPSKVYPAIPRNILPAKSLAGFNAAPLLNPNDMQSPQRINPIDNGIRCEGTLRFLPSMSDMIAKTKIPAQMICNFEYKSILNTRVYKMKYKTKNYLIKNCISGIYVIIWKSGKKTSSEKIRLRWVVRSEFGGQSSPKIETIDGSVIISKYHRSPEKTSKILSNKICWNFAPFAFSHRRQS